MRNRYALLRFYPVSAIGNGEEMKPDNSVSPEHGDKFRHVGERRHLTVVFCDLLGSTEVSTALDPEEYSEVLQAYQSHVAKTIGSFGGTIAQYLGDGVLAYFGYPQARENDAECAVSASLDIISGMPLVAHGQLQLKVRIGIASGLVVIKQIHETQFRSEPLAVGDTPNLAARLQAAAAPNGILIAESTRRLVGGLFELEGPNLLDVKGLRAPVASYEVKGPSLIDSRFEALRGEVTPFIGRREELGFLKWRWDHACRSDGRVVLFSGEPGIGKSRLLDQSCKELGVDSENCLRFYCSPLYSQTALVPFLSRIKKAAGFHDQDTDAKKLVKLSALLATALPDAESDAADLSSALGIAPPSERTAKLTAPQRREAAIRVLLDYPLALSNRHPVLILLEDAHWIDPTSSELLDRLVAAVTERRILLVVSARPEYQPMWNSHPAVTALAVPRLGWRDGTEVISGITRGKALPPGLTEQILERGDGIPLFLEELTKTLLEGDYLAEDASVALPNTLQDLLNARLDSLGPAKALAQLGAVIGREFSHALLLAVSEASETEITADLTALLASGLIYRRGVPPDAIYMFKHALIQDAAYNTLLKSRRQHLHATVAENILTKFPDIAATQAEVIAHHLTAAEDYVRAIEFWLLAGKAQIRASADLEAIDHLRRGIGLLARIPDGAQRREIELKLQTALIGSLVAVKGPFSDEVAACCERGLELSTVDGVAPTVFPFMYGQFTYLVSTGKLRQAAAMARRFIAIAEAADYASGFVVGNRMLGLALLNLAEFSEARRVLEASLAAYVPERDDNVTYLFGQNTKVNSQTVLSLVLFSLGEHEEAKRIGSECLALAEKLKHPHTTAISICYSGCWLNWLQGDLDEMEAQADRLLSISNEFGLKLFMPVGQFFHGLAAYHGGKTEAGIAAMEKALAAIEQANLKLGITGFICFLAKAKCDAGQVADADVLCKRASRMMEECANIWFAPELLSTEAEIAASSDPPDIERARVLLDEAVKVACELAAPGLAARAPRARDLLFARGFTLTS